MTLLDQIIKASSNPSLSTDPLKYPFSLNPNSSLQNLKFDPQNPNPNPNSILTPLSGFQIPDSDTLLIELNSKFFKKLKRKLTSPQSISKLGFNELINSFLGEIGEKKLGGLGVGSGDLIAKVGAFIGRDVVGLVIEGCVLVENWEVLESLVVNKLVDHRDVSGLVFNLVSKRRSELVCLCVRQFGDVMESGDLSRVLKYFLSPTKEGVESMGEVRKEWEREALAAIEKASDNKLSGKKLGLAKEAAVLLMVAYDGFSLWELCLHFVLSSSFVDEVVFSSAISKLNAEEMLGLVRYLGKWLRKYDRFLEAGPCPKAATTLGLKMCQWVPRVEDVIKCLGLVVDEHFSSLAMHSEFHEELIAIEGIVGSLVSEGRLSCSVANLVEILKPEVRSA